MLVAFKLGDDIHDRFDDMINVMDGHFGYKGRVKTLSEHLGAPQGVPRVDKKFLSVQR